MAAVLFFCLLLINQKTMKTISIPAPSATIGSQVQTKKATHRRSLSLHFLLEYGVGIALWAGITLCAALLFVFGLFLASGWSVFLGICAGLLSYVMFTNKDYDEYSIKEAIEMLATGKEVSK